jgi:prepilin-type N-terminal cleavage/methylation domain-containing protein
MFTSVKRVGARAFSLVELIAVIAILAILAAVAVPRFFDYTGKARSASVKSTLSATRSAIANFYADKAANGTPAYPTLAELNALGTVMQEPLPSNPYNNAKTIASATYNASAPPVSGSAGWNYDPATGRFWANSDTTGVDENEW